MSYSINEPPLCHIGDALVNLSSYVEDRKRPGFINDSEYLKLRNKAFRVLKRNIDLPDEVIMPYWKNYFHIILDAVKKDSELEANVEQNRASRTSPLADTRSPNSRKTQYKPQNPELKYIETVRAGSVIKGIRK